MLIPSVERLVRERKLHPFDGEWISRLRPASQLAAAKKCMRPTFTLLSECIERSTITHGTSRRLGAAG